MARLTAQVVDISGLFGFDPFKYVNPGTNTEATFLHYVRSGLVLAASFLFLTWIIMAFIVGFRFVTSLGNPDKIGEAVSTFKNLFIGITVTFFFVIILIVIANFFIV